MDITELVTPTGARVRVHILRLAISNAYLVEGEDDLVLVDAGLPYEGRSILRSQERMGRPSLNLIYLTHAHIDHFGGAAAVQRATGAPIAVHGADAADLAAGRTRLGRIRDWATFSAWTLPWIERVLALAPPAPPGVVVTEGVPARRVRHPRHGAPHAGPHGGIHHLAPGWRLHARR